MVDFSEVEAWNTHFPNRIKGKIKKWNNIFKLSYYTFPVS